MRTFRFVLFVCAASGLGAAPARDNSVAQARAALTRLPLRFEANLGQWDPAVRFAARGGGYAVAFTATGPQLLLKDQRVEITLEGSKADPQMSPLDRTPVQTNYFVGPRGRWRTGVPSYSKVMYRSVYPGIDVAYYGKDNVLEYDFLLQPETDPSAIRLRFRGADRVAITPEGDLQVDAAGGRLLQKRAYIYQQDARGNRRQIAGRYAMLANGAVGIQVGDYDRSRPLIIDPTLIFSSYYGTTAGDQINAVRISPQGLLYVVGNTLGAGLPVTADTAYAKETAAAGAQDLFIMTLDAADNFAVRYLSYIGGSGADTPSGVEIDAAGNLYIGGTTNSNDFPMAGESVLAKAPSTANNGFVLKFNPAVAGAGALVYSTYLGGTGVNTVAGIGIDSAGMIYVLGTTTSTDLPISDTAYAGVLWGPQDAFLCKIDTNSSTLAYSTYLGGEMADTARAIAVSPSGLVYFAVTTMSTQFPAAGAQFRPGLIGSEDIVLGVMDMTKSGFNSLLYTTYFGGAAMDQVRKLALDSNGRLLVTGYTFSPDFPVTPDAVQPTAQGAGDAFLSIVDPAHPESFLAYSTFLGGTAGDVAYDVAADPSGAVYVTGYTLSGDFPMSADALQGQWGGGTDIFLTKIRPGSPGASGLLFSTYLGPDGIHVANTISLGPDGTVYLGGYSGPGLPVVGASAAPFIGNLTDGFVLAISPTSAQAATPSLRMDRRANPRQQQH